MAENSNVFEGLTRLANEYLNFAEAKKAAAWYIDTTEKLANQALDLHAKATGWAKDTAFAPLFEAQNTIGRKFVERSTSAARSVWQLQ